MEKMVKCKACGKEIAKSANVCPNCGARQFNVAQFVVVFAVSLVVFFGIFYFILFNPFSDSEEVVENFNSQSGDITLDEFNAIKTGMTYEEVVHIIGTRGTLLSESNLNLGEEYVTRMYTWDGVGSLGANANVTFQNGKVVSKAQFGLK